MDVEKIMEVLLRLAPHAEVSSHNPGKIALKLRLSGMTLLAGNDWEGLIESIPGILSSRFRLLTQTIVFHYNTQVLPSDLWEDIARLKDEPELSSRVSARLHALSKHPAAQA